MRPRIIGKRGGLASNQRSPCGFVVDMTYRSGPGQATASLPNTLGCPRFHGNGHRTAAQRRRASSLRRHRPSANMRSAYVRMIVRSEVRGSDTASIGLIDVETRMLGRTSRMWAITTLRHTDNIRVSMPTLLCCLYVTRALADLPPTTLRTPSGEAPYLLRRWWNCQVPQMVRR